MSLSVSPPDFKTHDQHVSDFFMSMNDEQIDTAVNTVEVSRRICKKMANAYKENDLTELGRLFKQHIDESLEPNAQEYARRNTYKGH